MSGQTEALLARVRAIAAETRYSYGSRRMAKQLQEDGFAVGRSKARRLMKQGGVSVRRRQATWSDDHGQSSWVWHCPQCVGTSV